MTADFTRYFVGDQNQLFLFGLRVKIFPEFIWRKFENKFIFWIWYGFPIISSRVCQQYLLMMGFLIKNFVQHEPPMDHLRFSVIENCFFGKHTLHLGSSFMVLHFFSYKSLEAKVFVIQPKIGNHFWCYMLFLHFLYLQNFLAIRLLIS